MPERLACTARSRSSAADLNESSNRSAWSERDPRLPQTSGAPPRPATHPDTRNYDPVVYDEVKDAIETAEASDRLVTAPQLGIF